MEEKEMKDENLNVDANGNANDNETVDANVEENETHNENAEEAPAEDPVAKLEQELKEQKDQYLRLLADFENFRKNQLKKVSDLLQYGGEEVIKKLLPVIDDFERAVEHNEKTEDVEALREGFKLIFGKLKTNLEKEGVTVIPSNAGDDFDENVHEAITMFPAPDPSLKGKIVDCATKGYKYKDKVIRIAKVVVGE